MIRKLIYIPNGIMVPEIHVMLSLTQNLIDDKKNKVRIITCGGDKDFACSKNVFAIKEICKACVMQRKKAISTLKGNFEVIEIKKKIKKKFQFNFKNVKNLYYEKMDFGLGVYSSYTNTTRDSELDGKLAKKSTSLLFNTSTEIFHFFKEHLKTNKYDEIITFNSRMNERRPLFRFANKKKLKISNYEKLTIEKFYNFKNNFSQDRKFLKKQINYFNSINKNYSYKREREFYRKKFFGKEDTINPKIYSSDQVINKLPTNWNDKKKNIVFFTASDDEYQSFGKNFNPLFLKNQKNIIEQTCKLIEGKKDYHLWIRIHPRWDNVRWFDKDFYKLILKKYQNVGIIYPKEDISSYTMVIKSFKVICFWSLLIAEAAYWRKEKTISLTRNDYSELGIAITPESFSHYKKIIFQKKKIEKKIEIKALKWAHFFLQAGKKIKYFKGTMHTGYTFRNNKLSFDPTSGYFYLIGKLKEKFLINQNNK